MQPERITQIAGAALVLVGLVAYFSSQPGASPTALIPAGFGLVLLILGFVATKPTARKHAMHLAAGIALAGVLGSIMQFITSPAKGSDNATTATLAGIALLIGCGLVLAVAVRSFIAARRGAADTPASTSRGT